MTKEKQLEKYHEQFIKEVIKVMVREGELTLVTNDQGEVVLGVKETSFRGDEGYHTNENIGKEGPWEDYVTIYDTLAGGNNK